MITWIDSEGDIVWRDDDQAPNDDEDWLDFLEDGCMLRMLYYKWMVLK